MTWRRGVNGSLYMLEVRKHGYTYVVTDLKRVVAEVLTESEIEARGRELGLPFGLDNFSDQQLLFSQIRPQLQKVARCSTDRLRIGSTNWNMPIEWEFRPEVPVNGIEIIGKLVTDLLDVVGELGQSLTKGQELQSQIAYHVRSMSHLLSGEYKPAKFEEAFDSSLNVQSRPQKLPKDPLDIAITLWSDKSLKPERSNCGHTEAASSRGNDGGNGGFNNATLTAIATTSSGNRDARELSGERDENVLVREEAPVPVTKKRKKFRAF